MLVLWSVQEKRSTAQMMREMRQGGVTRFVGGEDEEGADDEDDFFAPGAAGGSSHPRSLPHVYISMSLIPHSRTPFLSTSIPQL